MANFFGGFFKQMEKPQSVHPPSVSHEFSQYDSEYIKYCIEQEQTISNLETCLHTTDDPKEIAMKTLKTACDFYGADWASVIDLDLSLGVWSHGWWHNPDPKITSIQYADEFENLKPMTRWIEALKNSEPIIVLDANDPSLYRGRDSRVFVMAKILEDINNAIDNLPEDVSVFSVNKWAALALKSRIFLFEGTFRKYHGIEGWEDCLEECKDASRIFLETAPYTIFKEGETPYLDLFNKLESDRTEIILSRAYVGTIGLTHDCNGKFLSASMGRPGLTKDIVNSYLLADGSRFTDIANFDKMVFNEEVSGRDPRLAQTIRIPGYTRKGETSQSAPDFNATMTGYHLIKYVAESQYDSYNVSEQDLPVFRKGEVCLNYAEACAELGGITQSDLDMSVNLLRERVGMPGIDLTWANANPDPYLDKIETGYPGVTGSDKGVILEIRRERTIELLNEGHRYWDIMRWKAGARFTRPFHGIYVPNTGTFDLNGDGEVDLVIYDGDMPTVSGKAAVKSIEELELSEGNYGKVTVHSEVERVWDEDKDYLYPIPTEDRVLTQGKITQNPGWEDGLSFN